jgi:putative membrane protein
MSPILNVLESGLPVLLVHLLITLVLLGAGVLVYVQITPYREMELIAKGNTAAGIVLSGTIVALSIPLAATLATSTVALDILVWGIVAMILQLLTFGIATLVVRHFRDMIEAGNCAAALALVGVQVAVALLNAGAMAG